MLAFRGPSSIGWVALEIIRLARRRIGRVLTLIFAFRQNVHLR